MYAGHFSSGNSLLAGEVELLACGFMIVSGDPLWVLCILILSVYVNSLHPMISFVKVRISETEISFSQYT